jgi:glyoxylase-like metal-dependent hydrolase (beta-lactamase superfamily II)
MSSQQSADSDAATGGEARGAVTPGVHRFSLGDFECVSLSDGSNDYRPEMLFANAPKEELESLMRRSHLPIEHVTTPYTCLMLRRAGQWVLVDTGAGRLVPTAGRLRESMSTAGIAASDVGTVIITHAHPDHVGGNLDEEGHVIYSNAQFFVMRSEWEFWTSEQANSAPEQFVAIARSNLEPLRDRLTLVEDAAEIVPGIRAVAAIGHTPGHMALSITSGNERLLHVSDTVLYPWHLDHPQWVPVFDLLPEEAAATKRLLFDGAATAEALVFAHHFPPFPALGHVERSGSGWKWLPLQSDQ